MRQTILLFLAFLISLILLIFDLHYDGSLLAFGLLTSTIVLGYYAVEAFLDQEGSHG